MPKPVVERQGHIWWHSGLEEWAWLCWRCRTPGALWSGHEETWQQAYSVAMDHFANEHGRSVLPEPPFRHAETLVRSSA